MKYRISNYMDRVPVPSHSASVPAQVDLLRDDRACYPDIASPHAVFSGEAFYCVPKRPPAEALKAPEDKSSTV